MTELTQLTQVVEFAYRLNQQSLNESDDKLRRLARSRSDALMASAATLDYIEREYQSKALRSAQDETNRLKQVGSRQGLETTNEMDALLDQERKRLNVIYETDADYLDRRAGLESRFGKDRLGLMQAHVRTMNDDELRSAVDEETVKPKAVEAKERSWSERIMGVIQTINKVGEVLGLPQIPENAEELFAGLTVKYNLYISELQEAARIRGLSGQDLGDLQTFMVELYRQKAIYPSLSESMDRTAETLAKGLPGLGDDRLLWVTSDIRRVAFLTSSSMESISKQVSDVSRITGQNAEDVVGSFLDIAGFARGLGENASGATLSIENLLMSFVELNMEGFKYGISIEESAYLTKRFRNELDQGLFSVQDLISFSTSLVHSQIDKRAFVGYEIVDRMRDRPEYRELWDALEPLVSKNDVYGLDRMLEAIAGQQEGVLQEEFNIGPGLGGKLQQQLVGAGREIVEVKAGEFAARDTLEFDYVVNQLNQQFLGASPGLTPDQQATFRAFRLQDLRLRGELEKEDRAKVDDMMSAAEDVRVQGERIINTHLLNIGAEIDVWIQANGHLFGMENITKLMNALREKAGSAVPGATDALPGGASASWGAVGGFVAPVEPSKIRITSVPSDWRPGYENTAGAYVPKHRHGGVDIGVPSGTPLYAMADGIVVELNTRWQSIGGIKVGILYDNGYSTRYLHMSKVIVKMNQRVKQGELVGYSGGKDVRSPHLHLDVYKGGARKRGGTRIDPRTILPKQQSSVRPFDVTVSIAASAPQEMKDALNPVLAEGFEGLNKMDITSKRRPFEVVT